MVVKNSSYPNLQTNRYKNTQKRSCTCLVITNNLIIYKPVCVHGNSLQFMASPHDEHQAPPSYSVSLEGAAVCMDQGYWP